MNLVDSLSKKLPKFLVESHQITYTKACVCGVVFVCGGELNDFQIPQAFVCEFLGKDEERSASVSYLEWE